MDRHPLLKPGLVQVAGIHDEAEAAMLLDSGVDWIGIPLRLSVNEEDLTEADAARISRRHPGTCCLITYLNQPVEISDLVSRLQVRLLQLHGDVDAAVLPELRRKIPGICIVKSLVIGREPLAVLEERVRTLSPLVDAFITDTFNPETGAEGATGQLHDWSVSRRLVSLSPRPVILAGGLRPDNVAQAIRTVQPFGVDTHTGVEDAGGRKSAERVRAFVQAARNAFTGQKMR